MSPCKNSEHYENPFWEKSNPGRRNKEREKNAQGQRTKIRSPNTTPLPPRPQIKDFVYKLQLNSYGQDVRII